jgi:hypothetical protein
MELQRQPDEGEIIAATTRDWKEMSHLGLKRAYRGPEPCFLEAF